MLEQLRQEAAEYFGESSPVEPGAATGSFRAFDPEEFKDKFRARIAWVIIIIFLIGFNIILLGVPLYNMMVETALRLEMIDVLTAYAGILGPFVGVISGYYFKN